MPGTRSGIVVATTLNLRPSPSTREAPIRELVRGSRVQILDRVDGWYRVQSGQAEGFVHGDFIVIEDANPASGFLHEDPRLRGLQLEPSGELRIPPPRNALPEERAVARTWNSQGNLLQTVSGMIGIDTAAAVAVLCVESGGRGFNADGSMIIRFENHVFWREWGKNNPQLFHMHFRFSSQKNWQGHEFRERLNGKWTPCHESQEGEWKVLACARSLHETAALRSISMGTPQIMGFNFARIGYPSVREMFDAFVRDIRYQTISLFDFIQGPGTTSPMLVALQREKFADFATHYNGPGQAAVYGGLIEKHFHAFDLVRPVPRS